MKVETFSRAGKGWKVKLGISCISCCFAWRCFQKWMRSSWSLVLVSNWVDGKWGWETVKRGKLVEKARADVFLLLESRIAKMCFVIHWGMCWSAMTAFKLWISGSVYEFIFCESSISMSLGLIMVFWWLEFGFFCSKWNACQGPRLQFEFWLIHAFRRLSALSFWKETMNVLKKKRQRPGQDISHQ